MPLALPLIDGPQTLVSFHAGANDALRPNFDRNIVRTAYVKAVTQLVQTGGTILLFTVLEKNGNGGKASAVWEERMSSFNSIVREVADKFGLMVMDASMDPQSSNPNLLAFDRLHLNTTGHYRVAHAVLERIGAPFDSVAGKFYKANFEGADLNIASFTFGDLREANLRNTNMYRADLIQADLTGADITNADLTDANVDGAIFTNVKGLSTVKGFSTVKGKCLDCGMP